MIVASSLQKADDAVSTAPEGGKARRVYLLLKDEISRGVYPDGTALPGEQKLAAEFDVSRVTVRRALEALDGDGLIEKRPGSGTIVRAGRDKAMVSGDFTTLMPQLIEMGCATEARLLSFAYGAPAALVASALGLGPDARVQSAVRVRLIDGVPFSHLTTHVPEDIARNYSEADLATSPLFRLLERGGVTIGEASQSVSATLATPDAADALNVAVGAALLSIERVVRDETGRGIEFLFALYRPDMFRMEMTLSRVGEAGHRQWAPVLGGNEAAE
ncbi:MAG: GntR family transcriptional regulator [Alphaproteobacteria bacterium]|nr:GntR family transcriptional regulator [Alphaproteobacteria bacterium]NNF23254.1 GntR family transcriptional regulator [Paracoccaceae bacterium]